MYLIIFKYSCLVKHKDDGDSDDDNICNKCYGFESDLKPSYPTVFQTAHFNEWFHREVNTLQNRFATSAVRSLKQFLCVKRIVFQEH